MSHRACAATLGLVMLAGLVALAAAPTEAARLNAGRPTPIWAATATALIQASASPPPIPLAATATPAPRPATILLYAPGAPAEAWAEVQWQDAHGTWHAVAGWRGPLDPVWRGLAWAVAPDQYGQGPFRWRLYRPAEGHAVVSAPFALPADADQIHTTWLSFPEEPAP